MTIPFHPYADLFPLLEGAEFDEFAADVRKSGLREKIVLLDGQILDGRNRYRALMQSGGVMGEAGTRELLAIPALARVFDPLTEGDPLSWVISLNIHRRHLSESQRAMIAAKLATLPQGRPSEWRETTVLPPTVASPGTGDKPANLRDLSHVEHEPLSGFAHAVRQADAATMLNVSERSVQTARQVREHGAPELVDKVERGEIKVSAAAEVAKLPLDEQLEVLRAADPRALRQAARERGSINGARSVMASRTEPDDSLDYFPTPPWATRALLEDVIARASGPFSYVVERSIGSTLNGVEVREPACGEGHIAGVIEEYGAVVRSSDVFDYSLEGRSPPGWDGIRDFGDPAVLIPEVDWVISNFPFGDKALPFTLRALDVARVGVALFVRQQWLEGVDRFNELFSRRPPTVIAQFAERVNLCKGRWDPEGSTATAYCWLVWGAGWLRGPPPGGHTRFMWIAPGRREARSKPDDVERFTAKPVLSLGRAESGTPPLSASGHSLRGQSPVKDAPEARCGAVSSLTGDSPRDTRATGVVSDQFINGLIRAGYAETPFPGLEELALRTGLSANAVQLRAQRMKLGSRTRQREAVAESNRRRTGSPKRLAEGQSVGKKNSSENQSSQPQMGPPSPLPGRLPASDRRAGEKAGHSLHGGNR